eukprot:15017311-Alexandrium_andersonii.AAC.1
MRTPAARRCARPAHSAATRGIAAGLRCTPLRPHCHSCPGPAAVARQAATQQLSLRSAALSTRETA